MDIFSGLIDGIFGNENESASNGKRKKLAVKNTKGLNPDLAAEKAAEKAAKAAYAAAKKAAAAKAAGNSIDVAKMLDSKAKARPEEGIAWRNSIIDLMKLCDLKSSFAARKELAQTLGYPGKISSSQSAKMNVWLHKEMMRQIVANGGKVSKKLITQ